MVHMGAKNSIREVVMAKIIYFPEGYQLKIDPQCWTVMVPITRKDKKGKTYVDQTAEAYFPTNELGFREAIHKMLAHHLSHKGEVSHKTFLEVVSRFRDEYLRSVEGMVA